MNSQVSSASRHLNSSPQRPVVLGVIVIAAFVFFLGIWGFAAPVSGAAIAEGNLQVQGQRQTVQHPYGGVVARLAVAEGAEVKKGDVLIELTVHEPRAKLDVLKAERSALLAQESRLVSERDGGNEPSFSSELVNSLENAAKQAIANERAMMTARSRQFESQRGMLHARISQLREQIAGLNAQAEGLKKQGDLIEEEAQGARQLLASGYTPKTRVLALDRSAAQIEADRDAKKAEASANAQAIAEAELAILKLDRERISEITGQLRQTQASLAENGPKLEAATDVLSRTSIVAPTSGSVVGLSVFTEGGVVQAGAKLMDIVPSHDELIADARLQLFDVGDVKKSQVADVRLTSVPRNDRPQIRGEILTVSADRLTDERSGKGYYSVRVKLNADDVRASRVALQAGMPTEVIVTTRPRTLVGYLIGPLADEIGGAFRER